MHFYETLEESGIFCLGWRKWDVLSRLKNQYGMFCPPHQISGMFCLPWQSSVGSFVHPAKNGMGAFVHEIFCPAPKWTDEQTHKVS